MTDGRKTMLNRSYLIFIIFGIITLAVFVRVFTLKLFEKDKWAKEEKRIFKKFTESPERGRIYDCNGKLLLVTIRQYDLFWDTKTGYIKNIIKKDEADTAKKTFGKKIVIFFKSFFKQSNNNGRDKIRKEFYLKIDSLAISLAKHNGTSKNKELHLLKGAIEHNSERLPIAKKISYTEYKEFYTTLPIFKKQRNIGGLFDESTPTRAYTYGEIAKVVLGNYRERTEKNSKTNKDENKILFSGLDGYYNKELSGKVGLRQMQLRKGTYSPTNDEYIKTPVPGYDIISTIDIDIQDIAHNSLNRQLDSTQASHGCVIVMEVKTGHVKAIVNLKREKDGKYHEGYVDNSVNYAISDNSDVGSIFKLASVIAVLEIGKLNENSIVKQGKIRYGQEWISDSHILGGTLSLRDAFKKSSNVGISQAVIKSVGNINDEDLSNISLQKQQLFIDMLYKLSLDSSLMNLDIVGEKKPFIKNIYTKEYFSKEKKRKSTWSRLVSLPYISIGYEIRITPIKILSLYNAVANNGVMVKPMFVKEIRLGNDVIETKKTTIINPKICSEKTIKTVKSFLEDVTQKGGTAAGLFDSIYRIAGKTGTNQLKQENATNYGNKDSVRNVNYKSSFVGYFPADNPKYSCIVIVYEPKRNGYYGGVVAAPVFKDIADKIYASDPELKKYLKKSKTNINNQEIANYGYSEDIEQLCKRFNLPLPVSIGKQYVSFVCKSGKSFLSPFIISKDLVPNVIGMGIKDAIYLLEKQGLETIVSGNGKVISQSLEAGTKINKTKKQTILITLSSTF